MTLQDNLHYFKISIANTEQIFDDRYMFLDLNKDIDKYVEATQKTKELLATIKTLRAKGDEATETYKKLFELWKSDYGSKSEFNCFLAACDTTREDIEKDFVSFVKIVNWFLEHRSLNLVTPHEWVQALLDSIASKSKRNCGEEKLSEIAQQHGFKLVDNWDSFKNTKKSVAIYSNKVFDLDNINTNLKINLPNENQNKKNDIILKNNNLFVFIEAKHLKGQGGEQGNQVGELINLIKKTNVGDNVYLGGFLDGVYSNKLLSSITDEEIKNPEIIPSKPKKNKQKKEIIETLNSNPNSFWFNTAGFKEFVKDFGEI